MSVRKWINWVAGKAELRYNESLHHDIQRNLMREVLMDNYRSAVKLPGLVGTAWRARYHDIHTIQLGIRFPGPNWSAEQQRRLVAAGLMPQPTTADIPQVTTYGPLSPDWGRRAQR